MSKTGHRVVIRTTVDFFVRVCNGLREIPLFMTGSILGSSERPNVSFVLRSGFLYGCDCSDLLLSRSELGSRGPSVTMSLRLSLIL